HRLRHRGLELLRPRQRSRAVERPTTFWYRRYLVACWIACVCETKSLSFEESLTNCISPGFPLGLIKFSAINPMRYDHQTPFPSNLRGSSASGVRGWYGRATFRSKTCGKDKAQHLFVFILAFHGKEVSNREGNR